MRTVVVALTGVLAGAGIAAGTALALWPDDQNEPFPKIREEEVAVREDPVRSGVIDFDVYGVYCGWTWTTGTHAEYNAKGMLCRVGVSARVDSLAGGNVDNTVARLVLSDGTETEPSNDAMQIKRQLPKIDLGAKNTITFDLWFDIPLGAKPKEVRIAQEGQPTATVELPLRDWKKP